MELSHNPAICWSLVEAPVTTTHGILSGNRERVASAFVVTGASTTLEHKTILSDTPTKFPLPGP
jgi:hypothetical protein